MPTEHNRGFTLLELLVVVAIAGMLAAAAVPGYRGAILRAGRSEARAALLALATAQEKLYLQCHTYAATLDPSRATSCLPLTLKFPLASERGAYALAVTDADAASWSATATSVSGSAQRSDRTCRMFRLTSQGVKSAVDDANRATDRECWDR
jgi:type IV pilus assembly protein PilE